MKIFVISALCLVATISAFPDGAPIDACIKAKPNQPNHSGAVPQSTRSPYQVEASSDYYRPGDKVTVKITAPGSEDFKGFFLQARDSKTNEWIGHFNETPQSKSYPECSAVTHTDNTAKKSVTVTWTAPPSGSGNVYFTGTVVKNYNTYWSDIVAKTY